MTAAELRHPAARILAFAIHKCWQKSMRLPSASKRLDMRQLETVGGKQRFQLGDLALRTETCAVELAEFGVGHTPHALVDSATPIPASI
jgi:hypothetical protein